MSNTNPGSHFNNNKLQNTEAMEENQLTNAESWTDGEFEPVDDTVNSKFLKLVVKGTF